MKHVMKSLKHNGIYVPQYDYRGFSIRIQGNTIKLTPKSEQMAIAWIKKRQSAGSPPDKVFMKNFMHEFLEQLKLENPTLQFLGSFASEYIKKIDNLDANEVGNPNAAIHEMIDFSEISNDVEQEKQKKLGMTKTEKKRKPEQRLNALRVCKGAHIVPF